MLHGKGDASAGSYHFPLGGVTGKSNRFTWSSPDGDRQARRNIGVQAAWLVLMRGAQGNTLLNRELNELCVTFEAE
ncbi:MAG: hypothetical protein K0S94_2707 [Nitrospira sp.]|jgi:hypothetical protein|nr:hypothetical protein [Nitrospira sp.]